MAAFVVAPGRRIHLGGGNFAIEGDAIDLGPADAERMGDSVVPVPESAPAPEPAPGKPSRRAAAQPEG